MVTAGGWEQVVNKKRLENTPDILSGAMVLIPHCSNYLPVLGECYYKEVKKQIIIIIIYKVKYVIVNLG